MKQFEYKSIRFDYLGRGITQEFNLLDINGVRVLGWLKDPETDYPHKSLPVLLDVLGKECWEMISHTVNQDLKDNAVTLHYMQFKREITNS